MIIGGLWLTLIYDAMTFVLITVELTLVYCMFLTYEIHMKQLLT
jgi:hypothetical protein